MAGTMTVSRLDPLWADYQAHPRSAGNQWCHAVGIPLILAGLLGLLAVPVFEVEGARVEASLLLIAVMAGLHLWLGATPGAAPRAAPPPPPPGDGPVRRGGGGKTRRAQHQLRQPLFALRLARARAAQRIRHA